MWFVYILQCKDGSLYTGVTNNLAKRLASHLSGKGSKYTRSHKPVKIVYQEEMVSRAMALKRELEIKALSKAEKTNLANCLKVQKIF